MSFRVKAGKSVSMLPVAREEFSRARAHIAGRGALARRVHEIRRSLKRLRAVLRLLDRVLSPRVLEAEDRRLRDTGRVLSPLRDAQVLLCTLDKLGCTRKNKAAQGLHQGLLEQFVKLRAESHDVLAHLDARLSLAQRAMERWAAGEISQTDLFDGLHQLYKQTRKCFERALRKPKPRALHKWRQQTKTLWHGFQLLDELSSKDIRRVCRKTDTLSTCLGLDHDLVMLQDQLDRQAKAGLKKDARRLQKWIARKRAKLQRRAFRLGKKIFVLKPAAFAVKGA